MTLQHLLILKADAFGTIERPTANMLKFRQFTNEKKWCDNMIIYFNNLYTQIVDVESHVIEYYVASIDTIYIFWKR